MALKTRALKGSELTFDELDGNFGTKKMTQASHGFSVGDVLYRDSDTTMAKAQANAKATCGEVWLTFHVIDANTYWIVASTHLVTWTAHGLGSGGTRLWLSQSTAGAMVTTEPTSGLIQPLGEVVDTNTILWRPSTLVLEV